MQMPVVVDQPAEGGLDKSSKAVERSNESMAGQRKRTRDVSFTVLSGLK